jgi:hypothetical protein
MKKAGLVSHKGSDGLIQMVAKSGAHIGKILFYAVKATKDEKSKAKLKELLKKKGSKEQLIDFLIKLDTVSLHLVSGPIHSIDALTGWHIGANLHDKVIDGATKVKDALGHLETARKKLTGDVSKKLANIIDNLKSIFPTLA